MQSILSYPQRGPWGDSHYRGNCSGFIIKDLLDFYYPISKPKQFIEVFSGGGTGQDVAKMLNLNNSIHLDIRNGWDAITDDLPCKSDFTYSHPPYWNIIKYNDLRMEKYDNELSNIADYPDFIKNLNFVNKKIHDNLLPGGYHAMLLGDVRRQGRYYSLIKDITWYGNLDCHLIKVQHNCRTPINKYSRQNFVPIAHEHILVFKKE